ATRVPLRTMEESLKVFPLALKMAEFGNPASVSDAGVGALAARAAVRGALLNVKINAAGLKNRELADKLVGRAEAIAKEAAVLEEDVLKVVESKI
ncbi:MAG: cyclodeaminase/cyclohydrolase family protein, partial [Duncaniella sp.]|nr:cyclodeaminase/cyclohydrolase family protein [Duncaniella sp.]